MAEIEVIMERQRKFYYRDKTKEIAFRLRALQKLKSAIKKHEEDILEALKKDLNKTSFEAYATEIGLVLEELTYASRHLEQWAKPQLVRTPMVNFPGVSRIYTEPYGVVLIMSPWNYPFQLTMAPLVGAIAAGNCVVLKPSGYSPNTSRVIEQIISEVFPKDYIAVIQGGREANTSLLEQKFDDIFFTGSIAVGKTVMKAASEHLTPVTLELGGKSPCIVDETADLELAARRIVWGKFLNAGQTCVAPDYLLVHHTVKEALLQKMIKYILKFYGPDASTNESFPKIINEKHFNRLLGLLQGEPIVFGGTFNKDTAQIAPTLLDQVTWDSPVMAEEIFGPILPVMEYRSLKEIIPVLHRRPKPLALYYFTRSSGKESKVLRSLSYGGGCINDTVMHLATSHMPFGGVGDSGMGGYHGKDSFYAFSHRKSILKKSNLIDIPLRYPPFKNNLKLIKLLLK